jgi:hypothetical protein
MTEVKLNDIKAQLEANVQKSLHLLALKCGLAQLTFHICTNFIKLWPYEITQPFQPDWGVRIWYCWRFQ